MIDPEFPPELDVAFWLNVDETPTLEKLKGRVVVLVVFQTNCQSSLEHALPQARRLAEGFDPRQVFVLGLNAQFEHKDAQTRETLEKFVAEQGLVFPVALDRVTASSELTATAAAYELKGTPSILIFDRQGRLRRAYQGEATDIRLSAEIMGFVIEHQNAPRETSVAIERMMRAALVESGRDHHHHHHHGHGDAHHHHHADGTCCNDPNCGQR